jgi:7-cyano-7-deazaguanine synthase
VKAVVLLSGGLDSTVALAHLLAAKDAECALALSFDYGQTHVRELRAASAIADYYGVRHEIQNIEIAPCPLTGVGEIPHGHAEAPDATFVPGRNLVMLASAVATAQQLCAGAVMVGANADDNAGYPDCRPAFLHRLDEATRAGYGIGVWAPFVRMTKEQIVDLGRALEAPIELTWSCYRGGDEPCGTCGACVTRKAASA